MRVLLVMAHILPMPWSSWAMLGVPLSGTIVISWLIHIGITISVTQSVGAYMMSSMYMFMVMSLGFIEQLCPGQPLSMTS